MDRPISIKDFSEKYKIYSYSMMRKLFQTWKLISSEKIWNVIIIDELIELDNIKKIKIQGQKKWRKPKPKINSLLN